MTFWNLFVNLDSHPESSPTSGRGFVWMGGEGDGFSFLIFFYNNNYY
jgi:hypothetical protein